MVKKAISNVVVFSIFCAFAGNALSRVTARVGMNHETARIFEHEAFRVEMDKVVRESGRLESYLGSREEAARFTKEWDRISSMPAERRAEELSRLTKENLNSLGVIADKAKFLTVSPTGKLEGSFVKAVEGREGLTQDQAARFTRAFNNANAFGSDLLAASSSESQYPGLSGIVNGVASRNSRGTVSTDDRAALTKWLGSLNAEKATAGYKTSAEGEVTFTDEAPVASSAKTEVSAAAQKERVAAKMTALDAVNEMVTAEPGAVAKVISSEGSAKVDLGQATLAREQVAAEREALVTMAKQLGIEGAEGIPSDALLNEVAARKKTDVESVKEELQAAKGRKMGEFLASLVKGKAMAQEGENGIEGLAKGRCIAGMGSATALRECARVLTGAGLTVAAGVFGSWADSLAKGGSDSASPQGHDAISGGRPQAPSDI